MTEPTIMDRLLAGESITFTSEPTTGLFDMSDRNYAPEPDGDTHYHSHSEDGLHCYGDSDSPDDFDPWSYDMRTGGRIHRIQVALPYCIYPCHIVDQNRRDFNIALLSEQGVS